MFKDLKTGLFFLFSFLFVFFVSTNIVKADGTFYLPYGIGGSAGNSISSQANFSVVTNWQPSGSYTPPSFYNSSWVDPCSPSKAADIQEGYNVYGYVVALKYVCNLPPHLSLSCSASSDSNGVVNLNKIYWVTNLSATDSSGNKVDTSKATYLWKDKGTGNSEVSNVNGSPASNSVTVSLNGATATAQCTLPPPPPLYVACYGSGGATISTSTIWTAVSKSYDYYGNSITPNYLWNDGKTGSSESTSGIINNVTANYTDIYGQKSAPVTLRCIPPISTGNIPKGQLKSSRYRVYSNGEKATNMTGSSLQDVLDNAIQNLKVSAMEINTPGELGDVIAELNKDGNITIMEYQIAGDLHDIEKGGGNVDVSLLLGAMDADKKKYGDPVSIVELHTHPLSISLDRHMDGSPSSMGFPPSVPDLASAVTLHQDYGKATITCLLVDGMGNTWQWSAPSDSAFAKDVNAPKTANSSNETTTSLQTPVNVLTYIGSFATVPFSGREPIQNYIDAASNYGVTITNVTSIPVYNPPSKSF